MTTDHLTGRVWDAKTGPPAVELKGHTGTLTAAAFSPDGGRAITASEDATARVWDTKTGGVLAELKGDTSSVVSAAFSPDGACIVTASNDQTARVWDARTGATLAELKGLSVGELWASFSADGSRVVTATYDNIVRVWDASTGQLLAGAPVPATANSRAVSPDGKLFLYSGEGNVVRVLSLSLDAEELAHRRYLTRPQPELHAAEAGSRARDEPFAAAMQRSFEQRARGVLAFEAGNFHKAQAHFITAALLKPKPPKLPDVLPVAPAPREFRPRPIPPAAR